jgi:hypothetical protein
MDALCLHGWTVMHHSEWLDFSRWQTIEWYHVGVCVRVRAFLTSLSHHPLQVSASKFLIAQCS